MIREWDLGHCCKRQGTVSCWCVVPVGKIEQMVHVKELNRWDFSPCINKVTVKKTRIKDHSISITRETTDLRLYADLLQSLSNPLKVINLSYPNISMHILHTVLYTFPKVLTRRICLPIKASPIGDHFLNSHDLNVWFRSDIPGRNLMLVTLGV